MDLPPAHSLYLHTPAGELELQVLYEHRWKVSNRRTNLVRIQGIILDLEKAGVQEEHNSTMQPILDKAIKAYACMLEEARKDTVVEMYEMANPEEGLEILAGRDADRINQDPSLEADPENWLEVFRADMDYTLSQWKPVMAWAEMKHGREQRRRDEHVKRVVDRQFQETAGAFLNPGSYRWGQPGDEVPNDIMEVSRSLREWRPKGKAKVRISDIVETREVMKPGEDEAQSPQSIDRVARRESRRERAKSIERAINASGLTIQAKEERESARDRAVERYWQGERRKSQQLSPEQQGEHPHPLRGNPPSQISLPLHESPLTSPTARPLPQTPPRRSLPQTPPPGGPLPQTPTQQQQTPSPPQAPPHRQLPRKPVRKTSAFREDLP